MSRASVRAEIQRTLTQQQDVKKRRGAAQMGDAAAVKAEFVRQMQALQAAFAELK